MTRLEAVAKVRELLGDLAPNSYDAGDRTYWVSVRVTPETLPALEVLCDDAAGLPRVAEPRREPCPRCAAAKGAR